MTFLESARELTSAGQPASWAWGTGFELARSGLWLARYGHRDLVLDTFHRLVTSCAHLSDIRHAMARLAACIDSRDG